MPSYFRMWSSWHRCPVRAARSDKPWHAVGYFTLWLIEWQKPSWHNNPVSDFHYIMALWSDAITWVSVKKKKKKNPLESNQQSDLWFLRVVNVICHETMMISKCIIIKTYWTQKLIMWGKNYYCSKLAVQTASVQKYGYRPDWSKVGVTKIDKLEKVIYKKKIFVLYFS